MNVLCEAINSYNTKEGYPLAICLMIFTLHHEEIIIIWSNLVAAIFSQLSNE